MPSETDNLVTIKCGECGSQYHVPAELLGDVGICRTCNAEIRVVKIAAQKESPSMVTAIFVVVIALIGLGIVIGVLIS